MSRWFFDHNVSNDIALHLRDLGEAVYTADDVHLATARDERLLVYAAEQKLILLTHNKKDFRLLHDA